MSNAFRQESYVFDLNWIFKSQKKIFEKIKVSILEWSFFHKIMLGIPSDNTSFQFIINGKNKELKDVATLYV